MLTCYTIPGAGSLAPFKHRAVWFMQQASRHMDAVFEKTAIVRAEEAHRDAGVQGLSCRDPSDARDSRGRGGVYVANHNFFFVSDFMVVLLTWSWLSYKRQPLKSRLARCQQP